jgi:hypothetical protein
VNSLVEIFPSSLFNHSPLIPQDRLTRPHATAAVHLSAYRQSVRAEFFCHLHSNRTEWVRPWLSMRHQLSTRPREATAAAEVVAAAAADRPKLSTTVKWMAKALRQATNVLPGRRRRLKGDFEISSDIALIQTHTHNHCRLPFLASFWGWLFRHSLTESANTSNRARGQINHGISHLSKFYVCVF